MKFQIRDIIQTLPEFGEREFVILAIKDSKYYAVAVKSKKRYSLEEEQISHKTGEIQADDPILQLDYYNASEGKKFALEKAKKDKANEAKWNYLANLKPNDVIEVFYKNFLRPATFIKINFKKPLLIFRVAIEDAVVDLPLAALKT